MYPLPLRVIASHAVLPPAAAETLFGPGYRLRGTERVALIQLGRERARVAVEVGPALRLVLDAFDRASLTPAPVRLRGPRGTVQAPSPEPVPPTLVLPSGLRRAWGLDEGAAVTLQVGAVVLAGARVADGATPEVRVDRAVALAGEHPSTACWLPGLVVPPPPEAPPPAEHAAGSPAPQASGRLPVITENDVRRARMRRTRVRPAPGQLVTPAARALGRELGVLDEPERPGATKGAG